jgi:hypothetical protein
MFKWRLMFWIPVLVGALLWIVCNGLLSTTIQLSFDNSATMVRLLWGANIGFLLIGWGFGMAYSKKWEVDGINFQTKSKEGKNGKRH